MKTIAILSVAILTTACANTGAQWSPVVDLKNDQHAAYSADLQGCQQYANQTMSAAESAATGAVAGAIFGALVGAAFGVNKGEMARLGALSGGVGAAGRGETNQRSIISKCLSSRGYSVLN